MTELLAVDNLHNPAALGPEGVPMDWHGVRVIYRVRGDAPTEAVVTEVAGGSTAAAAWFPPAQLGGLPLTEVAAALARAGQPVASDGRSASCSMGAAPVQSDRRGRPTGHGS